MSGCPSKIHSHTLISVLVILFWRSGNRVQRNPEATSFLNKREKKRNINKKETNSSADKSDGHSRTVFRICFGTMIACDAPDVVITSCSAASPGLLFEVRGPLSKRFLSLTSLPPSSIEEMQSKHCGSQVSLSVVELASALTRISSSSPIRAAFSPPVLFKHFKELCRDRGLSLLIQAYAFLSLSGWYLRHGGKFGAHFLAYRSPLDCAGKEDDTTLVHTHAEILVWVEGRCSLHVEEKTSEGADATGEFVALRRIARSVGKQLLVLKQLENPANEVCCTFSTKFVQC